MLLPADLDLVRRDTALPGLATVLDPDAFVDALRPSLTEANLGTAWSTYVRYKPGMNCLIAYQLEVGGSVLELYAKAHMPDAKVKLRKARKWSSVPGPLGPGHIVLEDRAIVVYFFPNDSKLKALRRLADTGVRKHLVSKLIPGQPDLWEGTLQSLRYKPERRYIAQLFTRDGARAVLRVYTESGYQLAQGNTKAFGSRGPLRLSRLLGRSDRHRILAFEWLSGRLLSEAILDPELELHAVRGVGAALAELHAQNPEGLMCLTREVEAATLLEVATGVGFVSPHLARQAYDLAQRLVTRLVHEPPINRPIHGDFYAKQVLLADDTVAFLDLDRAVYSDPAADLGLFIAHLERDALRGNLSPSRVETLMNALLEGYRLATNRAIPARIKLYTVAGLLRLAPDPFRYCEPNWPEQTEAILDRAIEIMKEFPTSTIVNNNYNFQIKKNINASSIHVIDPFDVTKDQYMPFLSLALNPFWFQKEFDTHIQSQDLFKGQINLRSIHVTRYKPGRRCIIEYTFEEECDNDRNKLIILIGKADASGLRKSGYNLLKSLRKNGFGPESKDEIYVPKPVGIIPRFNMRLQKKVFGKVSTQLITETDGTLLARRIADAAHKIHLSGIPTKRRHTIVDELKILHERLSLLSYKDPKLKKRIERLLKACERVGTSTSVPETCGIHRDFYPDQIVIDGMRLYVLDFDLYCEGDPALDIGNFLGHITEQSLRTLGSPDALLEVEQAMEYRFVELSGEATRPRVQAYKTLTIARHIYLSTQFPVRRSFTERLLELCEQRLNTT